MGPMLTPLFQTEGYLMPGMPIKIKYIKAQDAFYLVIKPDNNTTEYNFNIEKIGL